MAQYWFALFALSFAVGYVLGRLSVVVDNLREHRAPADVLRDRGARTKAGPPPPNVAVQIDDRKFVTTVTTSGMVKAEDVQLGVTQTKQDDINAAASKLAQLKRS